MPFQVGGVSLHDDYQHTGSAARDVAGGVAGLDAGGDLLAQGPDLHLVRDGSENIELIERTSGEIVARFTRVGVDDYEFRTHCGAVACIVQNDSMKDVVNGIAEIDSNGFLHVPGSKIKLARDATDYIQIQDRTSGYNALFFHYSGPNDFEAFITSGGVVVELQHEAMKDAANGIAGLDANILLSPALLPPCLEDYSNHLGATDNFTQTIVNGNATAVADAANHEMDLDSGAGAIGFSRFLTKDVYTPGTKPLVLTTKVQNVGVGVAGSRCGVFGVASNWTTHLALEIIAFRYDSVTGWFVTTRTGGVSTDTAFGGLVSGDLVTIVVTSSAVWFYQNGTLLAIHTTNITGSALDFGVMGGSYGAGVTGGFLVSVDLIGLKQYA